MPTSSASLKMSVSTISGTAPLGGGGGGGGVSVAGLSAISAPTAESWLTDALAVRTPVGPAPDCGPASTLPERPPARVSPISARPAGGVHVVAAPPLADPAKAATSMAPLRVVVTEGAGTVVLFVLVAVAAASIGVAASTPPYAAMNAVPPTAASVVNVNVLSPDERTCR